MPSEHDLSQELATYEAQLPTLIAKAEGKYALVHADEVAGTWDTYQDALQEGYHRYGLNPFLVKRIESVETIHKFTRMIEPCRF